MDIHRTRRATRRQRENRSIRPKTEGFGVEVILCTRLGYLTEFLLETRQVINLIEAVFNFLAA